MHKDILREVQNFRQPKFPDTRSKPQQNISLMMVQESFQVVQTLKLFPQGQSDEASTISPAPAVKVPVPTKFKFDEISVPKIYSGSKQPNKSLLDTILSSPNRVTRKNIIIGM